MSNLYGDPNPPVPRLLNFVYFAAALSAVERQDELALKEKAWKDVVSLFFI